MTPAVKICGLTRRADAVAAAGAGAAYLGAVFAAASPRAVSAPAALRMWDGIDATRVGVFVDMALGGIVDTARETGLDVVQLHGDEDPALVLALRSEGNWAVWKAVRMKSTDSFLHALDTFGGCVDGVLLDAWSPQAHGGTGAVFRWEDVEPLRAQVPHGVQLIVAGGLRADNLARAVGLLRPAAVDLSSGVESAPGIKDPAAIEAVMQTMRGIAS